VRPSTTRNSFALNVLEPCLLSILVLVGASSVVAANSGRVVIRDNVSTSQREELSKRLRTITGWPTLHFDSKGVLQLGDQQLPTGSAGARNLLSRAVTGDQYIVIEDASGRSDVAFCRVVPARWLTAGVKVPAFVVLIDFADFRQIVGDDEARAAFNVGWGVLHELDHVVSDSKDSVDQGLLGECEIHINAMRRELGLPLRADYFYTESTLKTDPNFNTKLVRLAFEQFDSIKLRTRRYWIVWDATVVGGLSTANQTASVQSQPAHRY
jgi:hypothetical protein